MNSEWVEASISEFISFRNGKSSPERSEGGEIAVFGSNGIIGYCDKSNAEERTLIIGRVGSYCGSVYHSNEKSWVTDNAIIGTPVNKDESEFWYFLLKKLDLNSFRAGSGQPLLNQGILNSIRVQIPKSSVSRELIGKHLMLFDNKIELNCQINQTLEQIAQAIFKSWFVDFEPVKAKIEAKQNSRDPERAAMCAISGKSEADLDQLPSDQIAKLAATAALFPDELEDSELGIIPKGWEAGKIGDVAAAKGGYAYKSKVFSEIGNPVIKIKNIVGDGTVDLSECQCIDDAQALATSRFKLTDGDLLMAMTGATVGKVGLVVTSGRGVYLNQRVAKFESSEFGHGISWFLFCAFHRKAIFEQVVGSAQGSAQPNISSNGIESTRLVVPKENCLHHFIDTVEPIFSIWMSNQKEIVVLTIIRDLLFPKLLSGESNLSPIPRSPVSAG